AGTLSDAANAGDAGNICLALNSATACQEPITLSPAAVTFPSQTLNTPATSQTITLTNNSGATLNGLALQFNANGGSFDGNPSDFNGLPNFAEQDTCASPFGSSFSLSAGASCTIAVSFAPQEGCPWIPFPYGGNPAGLTGIAPEYCPFPLAAILTVTGTASADGDTSFAVPITGTGL